ncbi:MAG: L-2-amino-thiazoline-4-carboxylic acid hydrolase [Candidatus Thorarchaeota archaeon]
MNEGNHKFNDKLVMTYAQYFKAMTSRAVSIIRAFESAFGREDVHRVLKDWSENAARKMAPDSIADFQKFKNYWKTTLESENWSKILTCEFLEESNKKLACKYYECLWAETMKDMNTEDIGYILFCHPDFEMVKAIHPNLRLERSRTLMEGDEFCDHTFYWDEKPTPD